MVVINKKVKKMSMLHMRCSLVISKCQKLEFQQVDHCSKKAEIGPVNKGLENGKWGRRYGELE